jgi:peroxiredoxin (alkyl hydroperoxide reductase subunit C)
MHTEDSAAPIQVSQPVADFELETYNPRTEAFDTVSSATLQAQGRWIILFFYPADSTFV